MGHNPWTAQKLTDPLFCPKPPRWEESKPGQRGRVWGAAGRLWALSSAVHDFALFTM
jgi:hypothetical protein